MSDLSGVNAAPVALEIEVVSVSSYIDPLEQALRDEERDETGFSQFVQERPLAFAFAAGLLGFLAARLARRQLSRSRAKAVFESPARPQPMAGPTKPHGDKLAGAARAAASSTLAPTYPEG